MTIENLQQNLIQDFEFFEDWTQKYEYMIELSKGLDKMDQEMKKFKTNINIMIIIIVSSSLYGGLG